MSTTTPPTVTSGIRRTQYTLIVLSVLLATAIAFAAFLAMNLADASPSGTATDPAVSVEQTPLGDPQFDGDPSCWQPQVPC
ncbi:MAG: hypothetical protein H0V10_18175 [Geodermatophilaceae bacterium]|nr:hypothetical protein [Geodermatophilaceae bacterium]